ncbi:hypothetical protein pipiens_001993 [Culex pipiens pipiens]|uniref:Uncharacterized protein n=1 Tax=Culex pipiens pipiens TaxID=38569 RepID=A0ABD1DMT9_CULPP
MNDVRNFLFQHHLYEHFGLHDIDVVISYEIDRIGRTSSSWSRSKSNPKTEEEYAVMYSAVLNDLCEGCEALILEKQTIRKIRSEMLIASMPKVNLLSKLKDRVDIDPALPAK